MAAGFDVETRWPELFKDLVPNQREAVVQALASSWYEGWVPNYEDVKNLTDRGRGVISHEEYVQRVRAAAVRRRTSPEPSEA